MNPRRRVQHKAEDTLAYLALAAAQTAAVPGIYNVVTYGADPTGTKDSTAAVQAAINAAIKQGFISADFGGGTVLFPQGQYKITSQITINGADGIRVVGLGGLSQVIWSGASASVAMFLIENCYRPSIENLFFSCTTPLLSVFDLNTTSGGNWVNTRARFFDCHMIPGVDLGAVGNAIFEYGIRCGTAGVGNNNDFHYIDHCSITGYGYAGIFINQSNIWQVLAKQSTVVGVISGSTACTFNTGASTVTVPTSGGLPAFSTAKDGPTTVFGASVPGKTIEVTDGSTIIQAIVVSVSVGASSSTITVNSLSGLSGSSGHMVYGSQSSMFCTPGGASGGGSYSFENGSVGNSLVADGVFGSGGGGSFKLSDVDSEGSRRIVSTIGASSTVQKLCLLENVFFDSSSMNSANTHMLQWNWGGALKCLNCQFGTTAAANDIDIGASVNLEYAQTSFDNCLFLTTLGMTYTNATGLFYLDRPTDMHNCRIFNGADSIVITDFSKNPSVRAPTDLASVVVANDHEQHFSVRTANNTPVTVVTIPLPGTAGADATLGVLTIEATADMGSTTTADGAEIKCTWGWIVHTPGSPAAFSTLQTPISIGTNTGSPPAGWALAIALDGGSNNVLVNLTGDAALIVDSQVVVKWRVTR